jgi:hypothetical protein
MDNSNTVALRRTSSSIISPTNSAASSIPVEDEEYGEDFDLSVSSHKRKQSGIPLEIAEGMSGLASKEPSLEVITDEEEGDFIGSNPLPRSQSSFGRPTSPIPEFEELFDGANRRFRYASSIKFLSTRNILILAFITIVAIFMTINTPSTPDPGLDVSRPIEADAPTEDGESHFEGVGEGLEFVEEVDQVVY